VEKFFLHDTNYTEAFANTDHTVLGKRLDPFCLWHQHCLELVQSKTLVGKPLTPFDLWVAVRVCTTPWSTQFRIPNLKAPSQLRWLWEVGRYNFADEVAKFSAYFEDYVSQPKLWPNSHEGDVEGAGDRDMDDNFEIAIHLVTATTLAWPDVWTMPIGAARWCSLGALKMSGAKVDIWTPAHQARFEVHVKKREAKIDARGKEIAAAENIPYDAARVRAKEEYWAKVKNQHAIAALKSKQHRSR